MKTADERLDEKIMKIFVKKEKLHRKLEKLFEEKDKLVVKKL